jgi:lauroyl/myristoyl acyltransferase
MVPAMAMRYRLSHLLQYGCLRFLGGVFTALPARAALAVGAALAWFAYRVIGFRAATARARIREAFGASLSDREVDRLAHLSLRNLFFCIVEIMRLPRITRAWTDQWVDTTSFQEHVERRMVPGQGAIFVVPHLGNWDLAGLVAGLRGHPVFMIAARQRNPLIDAHLNRMRSITGIEVVLRDEPDSVRRIMRRLREGKVLCILIDLRSRKPGMKVQFLGKEANIVPGLAMFARLAKVPVFAGFVRREGWVRHVWEFREPMWSDPALDKEEAGLRLTQDVLEYFETAVRRYPEQYFWYNKRWVLDPLDPPAPG